MNIKVLLKLLVHCQISLFSVRKLRKFCVHAFLFFALLLELVGFFVPELIQTVVRDILAVNAAFIVIALDHLRGALVFFEDMRILVPLDVIVLYFFGLDN